ncbi:hypothetical protein A3D60_02735 [Candidatus Uhrbacteria bacterium RIFCSPHIGHO2_02_FULL_47_29]|nr:MAG: hypothetical protein A3D60_02735 [Candidatus Uhrbacteria bacterium RIFCSPHIGHO2_02_FULL_47_29]OGL85975.1 MAG: hypothetical protein A3I37_00375 [Candidatus Uhrbacteria bacterium RIFCSPLOWO2_02_FULL_46_19]
MQFLTGPAAAVIQRPQALSGFIGRKASADGLVRPASNAEAQPRHRAGNGQTRDWERQAELPV